MQIYLYNALIDWLTKCLYVLTDADKRLGSLWHGVQGLRVHVQGSEGTCLLQWF